MSNDSVPQKHQYFPSGDFTDIRYIEGTRAGTRGLATVTISRRSMKLDHKDVPEDIGTKLTGDPFTYKFDNTQGEIQIPSNSERWYQLTNNKVVQMKSQFNSFDHFISQSPRDPPVVDEDYLVELTTDGLLRVVHTDNVYGIPPCHDADTVTNLYDRKVWPMRGNSKSVSFSADRTYPYPDYDIQTKFQSSEQGYSIATFGVRTVRKEPEECTMSTIGAPPFSGSVHPPRKGRSHAYADPVESCSTVYHLSDSEIRLNWDVKTYHPKPGESIAPIVGTHRVAAAHKHWGVDVKHTNPGQYYTPGDFEQDAKTARESLHLRLKGLPKDFSEADLVANFQPKREGERYQHMLAYELGDKVVWSQPSTWQEED